MLSKVKQFISQICTWLNLLTSTQTSYILKNIFKKLTSKRQHAAPPESKIAKKPLAKIKYLQQNMSRDMRLPTMWYVRPAKPQISLRIHTV